MPLRPYVYTSGLLKMTTGLMVVDKLSVILRFGGFIGAWTRYRTFMVRKYPSILCRSGLEYTRSQCSLQPRW